MTTTRLDPVFGVERQSGGLKNYPPSPRHHPRRGDIWTHYYHQPIFYLFENAAIGGLQQIPMDADNLPQQLMRDVGANALDTYTCAKGLWTSSQARKVE